jgi:CRP/FNR family transcriptional regulator, cyclic AMP receptor protein
MLKVSAGKTAHLREARMTGADQTISDYLAKHPIFAGLSASQLELIATHAKLQSYEPKQYVFERDLDAHEFFVVRSGRVTIEIPAIDGDSLKITTVGEGSLLGWSWLIPPYRWAFDARAESATTLLVVDGDQLRKACDADPRLGYPLMKAFAILMAERLGAARLAAIRHYAGG